MASDQLVADSPANRSPVFFHCVRFRSRFFAFLAMMLGTRQAGIPYQERPVSRRRDPNQVVEMASVLIGPNNRIQRPDQSAEFGGVTNMS